MNRETKAMAGYVAKTVVANVAIRYITDVVFYSLNKVETKWRTKRRPIGFR